MKKALIDPQTNVEYISSWTNESPPKPIYSIYPNSARVAQVALTEFEVAPPLFWVNCEDNVVQDEYWYDTVSSTIKPVENVPAPIPKSTTQGTQTL